ncbi:MAG: immunity 17 family protein [Bacteroidales bacterium]
MQAVEIFVGILFLIIGAFSFLAGILNWNWFFHSVNASIFLRWFGRTGARYFYGTIGIIVVVIGILMLSGEMN